MLIRGRRLLESGVYSGLSVNGAGLIRGNMVFLIYLHFVYGPGTSFCHIVKKYFQN